MRESPEWRANNLEQWAEGIKEKLKAHPNTEAALQRLLNCKLRRVLQAFLHPATHHQTADPAAFCAVAAQQNRRHSPRLLWGFCFVYAVEEGEDFSDNAVGFHGDEVIEINGSEQFKQIGIGLNGNVVFAGDLQDSLGDRAFPFRDDSRHSLARFVVTQRHCLIEGPPKLVH